MGATEEAARDAVVAQDLMLSQPIDEAVVVMLTCASVRERQAQVLAATLRETADRAAGRLVLDFQHVAEFSSAWINTLIELTEYCRGCGGRLVLCGLSTPMQRVLKSTGLLKRLNLARSREAAVRAAVGGEAPGLQSVLAGWLSGRARSRDAA
jgi:anti-anti-sigma factor